jgi:hypothetical protein
MSARITSAQASRSGLKPVSAASRAIDDTEDPGHLLNVWLGELDSLQKVTRWRQPIVRFENTAMQLWSQSPLHVQGDAGHPGR